MTRAEKIRRLIFYLLILFLPTQLGKHFWPEFAFINGLRIDYLSPTLYFTDLLIGGLLVLEITDGYLAKIRRDQEVFRHLCRQAIVWQVSVKYLLCLLFVCYVCLNIFFSLSPLVSVYKWARILEIVFLAFWVARHLDKKMFTTVSGILFLDGIGEAVLALVQFYNQRSLGGPLYFLGERAFSGSTPGIANAEVSGQLFLRAYGTFSHPNVLAAFLVFTLPFAFYFLQNRRQEKKRLVVGLGGVALVFLGLLSTVSRSGLIAGVFLIPAISLGIFWGKCKGMQRAFLGITPGLFAVVITGLILIFGFRGAENTESFGFREQTAFLAVKNFLATPFLGRGLGTAPVITARAGIKATNFALSFQPVHNAYLLLLEEAGIIGWGIMIVILWESWKKIKKNISLTFLFLTILLLGLIDHYWLTSQQGSLLIAVFFGLAWSRAVQV